MYDLDWFCEADMLHESELWTVADEVMLTEIVSVVSSVRVGDGVGI